jgi:membrane protease YdiL (CAAX protease family)
VSPDPPPPGARRPLAAALCFAGAWAALTLGGRFAGADPFAARSLAAGALSLSLAMALAALGAGALARETLAARLGLGPSRLDARGIALACLGFLALSQALDVAVGLSGLRSASVLARIDETVARADAGELALLVVALGVVPGIAEEVFCRGWLQRGLARRMPAGAAILASAALFGALHLDPVHAVSAFGLGLALGWLAWRSDGVRAPVACHVANNLAALATSRLGAAAPDGPAGLVLLALAASVAALALRAAARRAGAPTASVAGAGPAPAAP